jgi:hypothetical protein
LIIRTMTSKTKRATSIVISPPPVIAKRVNMEVCNAILCPMFYIFEVPFVHNKMKFITTKSRLQGAGHN